MGGVLGRNKSKMEGIGGGSGPGTFDASFKKENNQKLSLMSIITSITLGFGVALLGINYYHATTCIANSPDQKEAYINAIGHRLIAVEKQISQNTAQMNKLIASLQAHSMSLQSNDVEQLFQASQNEAIKIALELVSYPPPVMPDSIKYKYDESSSSSSSGEWDKKWGDDNFNVLGRYGNESSVGSYASRFDDLYSSTSGFKQPDDPSLSSFGSSETKKDEPKWDTLTDSEAMTLCTDMKHNHSIIPGVSWGTLPLDMQQKWLHYSCDYHLAAR